MSETTKPGPAATTPVPGQPRRSQLSRILAERPDSRARIIRAIAALSGTFVVAVAAFGGLLIWHGIRRGRLIRERLNPPRKLELPDIALKETEPPS